MRPARFSKFLKTAIENKRRVLVKGKPGCGKTDIVFQVAEELKADVVLMHPAISDPTDFSGLPYAVGEGKNKYATFLPFGQLRRLIEADKLTICFIDDIGQAAPAVQAALMQLVLARKVNNHSISDHVVFCGATNDTSHMASVSGMIEPLKSRWDTIVELEVSLDDWSIWALDNKIASELIAFLRFRPNLLSDFKPTRELRNSPSPRGWSSVASWMADDVKDIEVFSGAVGEGAATEFFGFLDMYSQLPSLDQILIDPQGSPVPTNPGALFAVAGGLARKATTANFNRITQYLSRAPTEFSVIAVRDSFRLDKSLAHCPAFVDWSVKNSEVLL